MEEQKTALFIEARRKMLEEKAELDLISRANAKKRRTLDIEATIDRVRKAGKLPRSYNPAMSDEKKHTLAIKLCVAYSLDCINKLGLDVNPNPPSGRTPHFE